MAETKAIYLVIQLEVVVSTLSSLSANAKLPLVPSTTTSGEQAQALGWINKNEISLLYPQGNQIIVKYFRWQSFRYHRRTCHIVPL